MSRTTCLISRNDPCWRGPLCARARRTFGGISVEAAAAAAMRAPAPNSLLRVMGNELIPDSWALDGGRFSQGELEELMPNISLILEPELFQILWSSLTASPVRSAAQTREKSSWRHSDRARP